MINGLLNIFRSKSYPLNRIYIDKEKLINNYKFLSLINPNIKIAPVLKSNAYGHGIKEIGRAIDQQKPVFICVDSLYEAYQLRKSGVKSEILIMGYIDPDSFKKKNLGFKFVVFDVAQLQILDRYQKGCKVHVFVDTGMHREGIQLKDLNDFLEQLKSYNGIEVEGIMTHLAMADQPKDSLTLLQIQNFKKAQQIFKDHGLKLKWFNLGGGVAALSLKSPPCNVIRVGKVLYGIGPLTEETPLRPILKLTTKIASIKEISIGDRVGYDGTFTAKKGMKIGILPIGYFDGVDRRLSGKGFVLVNGTDCLILGRISMNVTTIDLGGIDNPYVGQEVIVYSDNLNDKNTIQKAADIAGTIPYDLMVKLATSTRRIVS